MKRCSTCQMELAENSFHKDRNRKDGLSKRCKACAAEAAKRDRATRGEKRAAGFKLWRDANADHLRQAGARRRLEKRAMCLVATTRTRARKRGLEFDLHLHVPELQARIDKGVCELTGQPFDLSPGRKFNSPSLDRIDPSKGYTIGNVRVVLNLVNAALGDWGESVPRDVMSRWLAK